MKKKKYSISNGVNTEGIKQFLIDFQKRKFETLSRYLKVKPTRNFITSIIGARRAGKTYLLFNAINKIEDRKKVLYADFEYPQFLDFDGKNLKKIVDMHTQMFGEPEYLFFDEIQNLKNWEKGLREIYETKKYFYPLSL